MFFFGQRTVEKQKMSQELWVFAIRFSEEDDARFRTSTVCRIGLEMPRWPSGVSIRLHLH